MIQKVSHRLQYDSSSGMINATYSVDSVEICRGLVDSGGDD
jgi:hypothetical protein